MSLLLAKKCILTKQYVTKIFICRKKKMNIYVYIFFFSDEFDILPVHESVRNSCPVIHIRHKVALEDWCVKHVYVYCYSNFFAWKKKPTKIGKNILIISTILSHKNS